MDRLVCGDVGFGKMKVAMRAAFIATQNQKQVAVLVPTTLLAQQHYNNFVDRFADWPVTVEVVSRFKTAADVKAISRRLEKGEIDILVGTHKLLQTDFGFRDLGLLIIDEEHRFGVKQKEAIKALRSEVDILTMTATPIPRTLNMSLGGLRDLSIIATPPARRLSIKTFVKEYNAALVKEAILRETCEVVRSITCTMKCEPSKKPSESSARCCPNSVLAWHMDSCVSRSSNESCPTFTISDTTFWSAQPLSKPVSTSPMRTRSSSTALISLD